MAMAMVAVNSDDEVFTLSVGRKEFVSGGLGCVGSLCVMRGRLPWTDYITQSCSCLSISQRALSKI